MILKELRDEVSAINRQLHCAGLVVGSSGNASGYDPRSGQIVIKPSGVKYDQLTPESMVVVDSATGQIVDSALRPSVDLPHHLAIYRGSQDVRGVVHTHSNYATAFAACGMGIPACLTAIADQFGGEIPCLPYIDNDGDGIGQAIVPYLKGHCAVLLSNHGVFAWGTSPAAALKSAVLVEDAAKTVYLAMQIGEIRTLPTAAVNKCFDRYRNKYGQR